MPRPIFALVLALLSACDPNKTYEPACFDAAGNPQGTLMLVAGSDTWVDQVRVIDDGDSCSNAEHGATATDLANRTTHIRNGVPGVAPSIALKVPLAALANENFDSSPGSRWSFYGAIGPGRIAWRQTDVTDSGALTFHVPTTIKGKITKVTAHVSGDSGAIPSGGPHAGLPASRPVLQLNRLTLAAGTESVASQTDPSTVVGEYNTPHTIEITGLSEVIAAGKEYFITLYGESGTNASARKLTLSGIEVTIEKI